MGAAVLQGLGPCATLTSSSRKGAGLKCPWLNSVFVLPGYNPSDLFPLLVGNKLL